MLYGIGTLVLKGPKQRSLVPGTSTAAAGSILALKATLVAATVDKEEHYSAIIQKLNDHNFDYAHIFCAFSCNTYSLHWVLP